MRQGKQINIMVKRAGKAKGEPAQIDVDSGVALVRIGGDVIAIAVADIADAIAVDHHEAMPNSIAVAATRVFAETGRAATVGEISSYTPRLAASTVRRMIARSQAEGIHPVPQFIERDGKWVEDTAYAPADATTASMMRMLIAGDWRARRALGGW